MKDISKKRIGEILVSEKLITDGDVIKILNEQRHSECLFGEIAIDRSLITEAQLLECLIHQCGIPYLDLMNYDIDKKLLDLFPEHLLVKCIAVPIERIGKYFIVAITQLLDDKSKEHFEEVTKEHVFFVLAKLSVVKNILNVYYAGKKDQKKKEMTDLGQMLLTNGNGKEEEKEDE